jgi:hypothetical protein
MLWSIIFFIGIFVTIFMIGMIGSPSRELSEQQLQELERIKSNSLPPGDGSS